MRSKGIRIDLSVIELKVANISTTLKITQKKRAEDILRSLKRYLIVKPLRS